MLKKIINLVFSKKSKNAWVIILTLCFLAVRPVWGAVLYLEPAEKEYKNGDVAVIEARIDTEGECINTVKVELGFNKDFLTVEDFSRGGSILTHWIEEPQEGDFSQINREGKVSFSGGIPGGYCGRLPGDPGLTNVLGKIIFRTPNLIISRERAVKTEIKILSSSQVFLHDGRGTEAEIHPQGALLTISPQATSTEEEWEQEIEGDDIPPEPFVVEMEQDSSLFEGKYFLVFWTTDKQTGIDYFEVKEGKEDFERATTPYLLKDQSLRNKILVRAVDKAGNERVVEYTPSEYRYLPPEEKEPIPGIKIIGGGIALILLSALIFFVIKEIKKRRRHEKNSF